MPTAATVHNCTRELARSGYRAGVNLVAPAVAVPVEVAEASRILVIDDDSDMLGLIEAHLRAAGFSTRTASDGLEGLQRVHEYTPDVVFLDVSMAGMNGLEVLERIRAQALDMAVVMTTAFGSEQVAVEALRSGADDYLRKPFTGVDLQVVIERTIQRLTLRRHNAMLRLRLGKELARAAEIQAGLLPHAAPVLADFELAARCVPARQVGGDFYDWQQAAGLLTMTVGDVMGKGMPAAILMATVRAVLRAVGATGSSARSVQAAAATLDEDLARSRAFVTLFHLQMNLATGAMTFVDAGHGLALLRRANGDVELLQSPGVPVGILPNQVYEDGAVTIEPGDVLVVYSDGLLDVCEDMFETPAKLAAQIEGISSAPAIVQRVMDLAATDGPLPDDLTIAVLSRRPLAPA